MPAHKKDPSVRRRRNKASSQATLRRPDLHSVADLEDVSMVQLRAAIDELNLTRPADAKLSKAGTKSLLLERIAAARSPIPALPTHPPTFSEDDEVELSVEWHTQTRAWWSDVWTSPMASEWDDSDVHNVMVVALLYDDIWAARTPRERSAALAEYRLQRADLGLSPYSRRRLEWTIETADEAKSRGAKRRSASSTPTSGTAPRSTSADPRSILAAVE